MSASPPKILVVDDEPQIRRLLKTSLGPQKFDVAEAGTAGAALKIRPHATPSSIAKARVNPSTLV